MSSRYRRRTSPYSQVRLTKQDTVILNANGDVSRSAQARKRYAPVVPTPSPVPPPADDNDPENWSKATVMKRIKEDLGIARLPTSLKLPQLVKIYTENKGRQPGPYPPCLQPGPSVMDVQLQKSITNSTAELQRLMQSTNLSEARHQPQPQPPPNEAPPYEALVGAVRHLQESVNVIANTLVTLHNQLGLPPQ